MTFDRAEVQEKGGVSSSVERAPLAGSVTSCVGRWASG